MRLGISLVCTVLTAVFGFAGGSSAARTETAYAKMKPAEQLAFLEREVARVSAMIAEDGKPIAVSADGLLLIKREVDDYAACQRVAAAAHQLELHAVLAPSATGLGETLALFRERITLREMPVVQAEETWNTLPADPRQLRAVPPMQA